VYLASRHRKSKHLYASLSSSFKWAGDCWDTCGQLKSYSLTFKVTLLLV